MKKLGLEITGFEPYDCRAFLKISSNAVQWKTLHEGMSCTRYHPDCASVQTDGAAKHGHNLTVEAELIALMRESCPELLRN